MISTVTTQSIEATEINTPVLLKINTHIECLNLPIIAKKKIMEDLTFENKDFINAVTYGGYSSPNISENIWFYDMSMDKKIMWVPRGYIFFLRNFLKRNEIPFKIIDNTLILPKIDVKFQGKLRGYQEETVINAATRYPVGVIEAATGSGKTCMATGLIAKRRQPTLIIVHTKELLYQWQNEIKKFLDFDCGLIGDGHFVIKPITVGIINTVRKKVDQLKDKFGQIILDECHRVPSNTFSETIQEFPAKYFLGLSATPIRRDGLGKAIFYTIGPRLHEVDKKMLNEKKMILRPEIIKIDTDFVASGDFMTEEEMQYTSIVKKMTEDYNRNKLIAKAVYNDLRRYNENIIVVSDRVKHLYEIAQFLNSVGIKNEVLSGKTNTGDRKRIVQDVRDGNCQVLLSTISLIGEGFDVPDLTALFLTTPIKFMGRLIQVCGRILRPKENKKPRIYDFRDNNVITLRNSGFSRDSIYKKEGWI